jgi:hypothetical protein
MDAIVLEGLSLGTIHVPIGYVVVIWRIALLVTKKRHK